jgi:hypothetical protein
VTPDTVTIPEDVRALSENIGRDPEQVYHNCHAVSLAIVKSGFWPNARVARGFAKGVGMSQHSWVVLGDPYDLDARIIDATLWSYDPSVPGIWEGTGRDGIHKPHGSGHFMMGDPPKHYGGETIHLTPKTPLSPKALRWLKNGGAPFDYRGWSDVGHLPVGGWPAGEILRAMHESDLGAIIPIDVLGMATDVNPSGLYLEGEER